MKRQHQLVKNSKVYFSDLKGNLQTEYINYDGFNKYEVIATDK